LSIKRIQVETRRFCRARNALKESIIRKQQSQQHQQSPQQQSSQQSPSSSSPTPLPSSPTSPSRPKAAERLDSAILDSSGLVDSSALVAGLIGGGSNGNDNGNTHLPPHQHQHLPPSHDLIDEMFVKVGDLFFAVVSHTLLTTSWMNLSNRFIPPNLSLHYFLSFSFFPSFLSPKQQHH
jgi:hypothetical protein